MINRFAIMTIVTKLEFSLAPIFRQVLLNNGLSRASETFPCFPAVLSYQIISDLRYLIMAEPKLPVDSPSAQHSDSAAETSSNSISDGIVPPVEKGEEGGISDGPRELKETECYDKLGYSWPRWKKWSYLLAVACVQVSMNFNTSVFPNAVIPLSEAFDISQQHARTGQMAYLVTYSIGCELWAPWSEEFGRWPILQLSMFLINIWQFLAAWAPNWGSIVVARALGGISTAGGSVTLGLIADIYEPDSQQFPLAFIVFSSCIGTSVGGIIGGPIQRCKHTRLPTIET